MLILSLFSLLFYIVNCKENMLKFNITPDREKFYQLPYSIKFEIWRVTVLKNTFITWKLWDVPPVLWK